MSFIGLDLATTTGWASYSSGSYLSGSESFKPTRREGPGSRFVKFGKWLKELVASEKPDVVYYEIVERHLSTYAGHIYGGFLAVMQATLEEAGITYVGVRVQAIKKTATSKGNAKKDAMIAAAQAKWPDQDIADDNQADALWILETGMQS